MDKGPVQSSSNRDDRPIDSDVEEESVENFSFDVSPNIRADFPEDRQPSTRVPSSRVPRPERSVTRAATTEARGTSATTATNPEPVAKQPQDRLHGAIPLPKTRAGRTRDRFRPAQFPQTTATKASQSAEIPKQKVSLWKRRPAWVVSLGVHVFAIVVMSLLGFVVAEPDDFLLWASVPPSETLEEIRDIEIETPLELETLEAELPTELEDPGIANLGEVSTDSALADLSKTGPLSGESIGEWGSLFGDQGSGLAEMGLGQGNALTSFFGAKSEARKVVFVIDNTGSMRSGGLETVIVEMMKTVEGLEKRQEFYVLFFSDQVYPLFYPQSIEDFVHPTDKNKRELRQWLDTVEFCTGGVWQLTQALDAAYELKPEVVYLLTDGQHWDMVRADYKVQAVQKLRTEPNRLGIPIHTLGMGCKSEFDRENLRQVAKANGGTFREVQVSPRLTDVAYAKNRPYHIDGPGTVWGTLVRKRN